MCSNLHEKIGDILTPAQYAEVRELGLLVVKDDQVSRARLSLHLDVLQGSQPRFRMLAHMLSQQLDH